MPPQVAVTVRAPILESRGPRVRELLQAIRSQGAEKGLFPFARMAEVHFARLFVLEEVTDLDGDVIPGSLVYMADVDGAVTSHLESLCRNAPVGVDALFGQCAGYPADPTDKARVKWLQRHLLPTSAYYVTTSDAPWCRCETSRRCANRLGVFLTPLDSRTSRRGQGPCAVACRPWCSRNRSWRWRPGPRAGQGFRTA